MGAPFCMRASSSEWGLGGVGQPSLLLFARAPFCMRDCHYDLGLGGVGRLSLLLLAGVCCGVHVPFWGAGRSRPTRAAPVHGSCFWARMFHSYTGAGQSRLASIAVLSR